NEAAGRRRAVGRTQAAGLRALADARRGAVADGGADQRGGGADEPAVGAVDAERRGLLVDDGEGPAAVVARHDDRAREGRAGVGGGVRGRREQAEDEERDAKEKAHAVARGLPGGNS